jgi:fructokinase
MNIVHDIYTPSHNKKLDLFLLGESLIDIYIDHNQATHILFGGSPSNICINSKLLGLNPIIASSIGRDEYGRYLLSTFKKYQINTSLIHICDNQTSVVKMNQSNESPKPTFYRGCDYHIQLNESMIQTVKDAKIFHFSYWPLTNEPSKSTVLELIKIAKNNHTIISFDPNIHKDLLSDQSISNDEIKDILNHVDIIKPSLDDLERLFKIKAAKEKYMDLLESFQIKLIMITLGKDGVFVSHNKKRNHYSIQPKEAFDSTGAGDAFWSGFYAGYLKRHSIQESIYIGQKASGFIISKLGTILDSSDVKSMIRLMN